VDFNRIINGMIRVVKLDASFYNEVEADASYQKDALGVVLIVSALSAIGSFLAGLISGSIIGAIVGLVLALVVGIVGYFIWSFVAHWVGTKFFKGQGDLGEVQRALGFAYAPQALTVLSFIPCLGGLIGLIAAVLSIVTGFFAIRESLDQDNTNAALTMIVATVILFIFSAVIGTIAAALGFAGASLTGAFNQ
jgi:hypothetical protein